MGTQMSQPREGKGGFLDRWSRRKRESEAEPEVAQPETAPEPAEVSEDEISAEELAALPAPEDMTIDTDISPFLKRGVPRAMKNAALRRIWLLNPAIRDHRDLAVDYAWDWNTPGGVPGSGGEVSIRSVSELLQRLGNRQPELTAEEQTETLADAGVRARAEPAALVEGQKSDPSGEEQGAVRPQVPEVDKAKTDAKEVTRRHGGARPA